jgi:hypothetical protein
MRVMKHALSISLLVTLLASGSAPAQGRRPIPQGCKEDFGNCKEDCTIEYGGSTRTYKRLAACLAGCNENMSMCRERHYTALDSGLAPGALDTPRERDPGTVEHSPRYASEEAPASESNPEPAPSSDGTARRDVYRVSEVPEPKSTPVAEPAAEENDSEASEARPAMGTPRSESETRPAEPREEPARMAESEPEAEEARRPRPPPPAPRVVKEPERPKLPPEPKEDISEWDPDAEE